MYFTVYDSSITLHDVLVFIECKQYQTDSLAFSWLWMWRGKCHGVNFDFTGWVSFQKVQHDTSRFVIQIYKD